MARKPSPPPGQTRSQPDAAPPDRSSSPFAALAGMRDQLPVGPTATATVDASAAASPPPARGPARAIVRYERKGRGGKEVTLVEQLGLPPADLDTWCRDLKRALGCGGSVEQTAIALAGDQRRRLPSLLESRGVRRITVS
ncbi:MAG TPA: translation initiation factor [Kofleriaceae bacterium]|nr:translation initiation factor [Kofleriaceae bacterium]